jgi:hypothetical protein
MAVLALQVQDQPVEHASPTNGFKPVETTLLAIVGHQTDPVKVKILLHLASVRLARQAITKVLHGENASGVRVDVLTTVG